MLKKRRIEIAFNHAQDVTLCELVAQHACIYNANHLQYKNNVERENAWEKISSAMKQSSEVCKNRWRNIRDSYKRSKREEQSKAESKAMRRHKKWALLDHVQFLEFADLESQPTSTISLESLSEENKEDIVLASSEQESSNLDNTPEENPEPDQESDSQGQINFPTIDVGSSESKLRKALRPTKTSKKWSLPERNKRNLEERTPSMIENGHFEREIVVPEMNGRNQMEDDTDVFLRSMGMTMKMFHPTLLAEAKKRICNLVMDLQMENEKLRTESLPLLIYASSSEAHKTITPSN